MLVQSVALSEEQERERLQEQIGEVAQQEVRVELGSLRARLQCIMECVGTKYAAVIPPEGEVQEAAEEEPEQAHLLMDQITQPLQLYQDTAQQAEQRTAFLSKIPACLQEYEDIIHSAGCWLDESQSWLDAPGTYTTARSLQSQANTLQASPLHAHTHRHTLTCT
ncbi:unnamed protein product [Coregonus sp. 'balchen']|nr:unnamed protein product [Coregonus sp. 'balchen']